MSNLAQWFSSPSSRKLSQIIGLLRLLLQKEGIEMSVFTEWAKKEQADMTAINASLDAIVNGVTGLQAKIVELQATPDGWTPADQKILDDMTAMSTALVGKAAAIKTDAPGTLPPPPDAPPVNVGNLPPTPTVPTETPQGYRSTLKP